MKRFGGHQTKETEKKEERERQDLRNMVKDEQRKIYMGVKGRLWGESASARPNGLRGKA